MTFERIYRRNLWHGIETRSGPGSGTESTRRLAPQVGALVESLDATVLDLGCGEGTWQPEMPDYLGLDVSPWAVTAARRHHPERHYARWLPGEALPHRDLVLCRDVMQHLSVKDGLMLLEAIRSTGARYLLASMYAGGVNRDPRDAEDAYDIDLTAPPFSLGLPSEVLFDGYGWEAGQPARDLRKLLALWRIIPD